LLLVLLLLLLGSCAKSKVNAATEIVVIVTSDLALESVEAEILDEAETESADRRTFRLDAKTMLPQSFSVSQPAGGADWFRLVVRGFDDQGEKLVEHTIIAGFDRRRSTLLQLFLGSACAGNFCEDDPDRTCYGESQADNEINAGECQPVRRIIPKVSPRDAGLDADTAADSGAELDGSGTAPSPDGGPGAPSDGDAGGDASLEPCVLGKSTLGSCPLQ
jgi:hypothetical protein